MTHLYAGPADEFSHLRRQLYRLLDAAAAGAPPARATTWTPPADVAVSDTNVIISLELAGMERDQIEVAVEGRTLTVSGHRSNPGNGSAEQTLLTEWPVGHFARSFALGWEVDPARVRASLSDGVLEIRIARKDPARRADGGEQDAHIRA